MTVPVFTTAQKWMVQFNMENGKESGYRRKLFKNIIKKQPHFDFSTKVRLIFTLFLFTDDFC